VVSRDPALLGTSRHAPHYVTSRKSAGTTAGLLNENSAQCVCTCQNAADRRTSYSDIGGDAGGRRKVRTSSAAEKRSPIGVPIRLPQ
jgi:hypothetical protein